MHRLPAILDYCSLPQTLSHWLQPCRCQLCNKETSEQLQICVPCRQELPHNHHHCQQCALPLPPILPPPLASEEYDQLPQLCGQCLQQPPAFSLTVAPFLYSYPVSQLIANFKYRAQLSQGHLLSQLLAAALDTHYDRQSLPSHLVPVPLHWCRQWIRGFNQSAEIGRHLCRQLPLTFAPQLCQRRRATPQQQGLSRRQRQKNLKHSFNVSVDVKGKYIALLDDVVTTASTAAEISRQLLKQGASRVDLWCIARTPQQHQMQH